MKKWLAAAMVLLLTGCSFAQQTDGAERLRERAARQAASFTVHVTADYIDSRDRFSLECRWDPAGTLAFTVTEPEQISGIRGTVTGEAGNLVFEDQILALPLTGQNRVSPLAGPWIFMKALAEGPLTDSGREESLTRLTLSENWDQDAAEVAVWLCGEVPRAAEISWKGRRSLVLEIENFSYEQPRSSAAG